MNFQKMSGEPVPLELAISLDFVDLSCFVCLFACLFVFAAYPPMDSSVSHPKIIRSIPLSDSNSRLYISNYLQDPISKENIILTSSSVAFVGIWCHFQH